MHYAKEVSTMSRKMSGKDRRTIITVAGTIIVAIISGIFLYINRQPLSPTNPPILTPSATTFPSPNVSATLSPTVTPSATAVSVSSTATWVVTPTASRFGAEAPNHTINLTLNPGEILSLTTDVGMFMARIANGSLMSVPLQPANDKVYVLIWEGDRNLTA